MATADSNPTDSFKKTDSLNSNKSICGRIIDYDSALNFLIPASLKDVIYSVEIPGKGNGTIFLKDFKKGDVIFEEEAYMVQEPYTRTEMKRGDISLCSLCCKVLSPQAKALVKSCRQCGMQYCNSECYNFAMKKFHPVECLARNPQFKPLHDLLISFNKFNFHGAARCWFNLFLTYKNEGKEAYEHLLKIQNSFHQQPTVSENIVPFNRELSECSLIFLNNAIDAANLETPPGFDRSYAGWLRTLSMYSLNNVGGCVFAVHAKSNHSCDPNVTYRNIRTGMAVPKLGMVAARDIKAGEEMTLSYIHLDPGATYKERREKLLAWDFICTCTKCLEEEEAEKQKTKQ